MTADHFFEGVKKLDALMAEEDVETAFRSVERLLATPALRRYFFESLTKPSWLPRLHREGFFQVPPAAIREGDSVSFPPWPESQCLARMGATAPELILDMILEIPETDNERIHQDLAEAAVAIPAHLAAKWVQREIEWLRQQTHLYLLLPEKLAALIPHLAASGEIDTALNLARVVLEVLPGIPRPLEGDNQEEEVYQFTPEPRGRFDQWYYGRILEKYIPDFVGLVGEPALWLLCDLLDSAIRLSGKEEPEDYSYIWRPAIEDHEQNQPHEMITDALVTAARDAAEQLVEREPGSAPDVVGGLGERPWHVFRRLALHLLRRFPDAAPELIAARLTNHGYFNSRHLRHEYVQLAKKQFGRLPTVDQEVILGWIEEGPDLAKFADDETELRKRYWQRDRLAPIADSLPSVWRQRYDALVQELGEAAHPDFVHYMTSWSGPTTPKSADDLRGMGMEALVTYLHEWQPPEGPMADSREGLALQLTEVVAAEPERFARDAARFEGLHLNYIHAFCWGLEKAVNQGLPFPWAPTLDLCRSVATRPRELFTEEARQEHDDWGESAKRSIVSLVAQGLEKREIPLDLREAVWDVVESLSEDPDPTSEREEARQPDPDFDPYSLSINCVRGNALHAVVRYALWIRQHLDEQPDAQERIGRGFDEIPEVRVVLDRHLDPQHDPSWAIRAVYGRWFPWLHLLDPEWATSRMHRIFPTDAANRDLHDAAWQTYVCWCPLYKNVAVLLTDHYRQAIETLGPTGSERRHQPDPQERLTEHLMILYWVGQLALDEPRGMLDRFYAVAPLELRTHAIDYAGRSLSSIEDEPEPGSIERMKALWQYRFDWVQSPDSPADAPAELVDFGWWFTSGKLDDEWALAQLQEVLRLGVKVEPDHMVVRRLAEMVGERPLRVVRCLAGIVEADQEGWSIHGWMDEARSILAAAVSSDNPEAREAAIDLIHRLGARGHWDFRDLLPTDSGDP